MMDFLFPPAIYRHPSARLDFKFFLVNTVFYGVFVAPMIVTSVTVARFAVRELTTRFGVLAVPLADGMTAAAVATVLIFVAADLGFYVSHYLQHKVPILWEFHKVHHSAEALTPITAFRSHPIDQALDAICMGTMTGLAIGCSTYCFGASIGRILLLGTNLFVFIFNITGAHLRHSHLWLSYGARFSRIFVSPAMHQIHHSRATRHIDRNLGGCLAIWDRLMGTLYVPRAREEMSFGLAAEPHQEYSSLSRLYFLPLLRASKILFRRDSSRR